MKRKRSVIAALLCAVLMFMAVAPMAQTSAEEDENVFAWAPKFAEKIRAFLNQENADGITNGELMCEQMKREYGFDEISYDPQSDASFYELLRTPYFNSQLARFSLSVVADKSYLDYAPLHLRPALSGTLDLSDTEIALLEDYVGRSSALTSINLNGCVFLNGIAYTSAGLEELHAVGTNLVGAVIDNRTLKVLEIQLRPADEPVRIDVLGEGSFNFKYNTLADTTTVHYPISESPLFWKEPGGAYEYYTEITSGGKSFIGWYKDGKPASIERVYVGEADKGVHLTAVFKGDANGDWTVDSSDALAIMRSTLGIGGESCEASMCDMDGSGTVDSSDALMLLRFTLGIL